MSPDSAARASSPGVLERILTHARGAPGRPAAADPGRELDYGALCTEVGEVAAGLVVHGVEPGDRVALHLPNSVDFLVAALAALWVGAIFVPLAVTDPESRLTVIVGDCDPVLIVTGEADGDGGALTDPRARTLAELRMPGVTPPAPKPNEDQPVYAIYTSGTTGTPKGVLIGQDAFVAAVVATVEALDLDDTTRTLCVSAFHFDGSFATLFPTLVAGGRVVIPRRDSLVFARTFFSAVAEHGITYTGFSPSYLRLLLSNPRVSRLAETPLRVVALGGEAASRPDVEAFRAAAPGIRIFNRYGPTETTIAVTHHEVAAADEATPVSIGTPHPGVTFVLLDEDGGVMDGTGRLGELYIGGVQLMLGYWRAPDLSAAVLRSDVVAGTVLYRTGDLVIRDEAGDYLYVDRADRVVKRSGVRISLLEITEVLRGVTGVSAAATTMFDDGGEVGIVAFVVVAGAMTAVDVQRTARHHLPATMLPDRVVTIADMPLTPAGKVDERRLLSAAGLLAPLGRTGAHPVR